MRGLCIGCGRCALVCPYEGMDISKPFQGEIKRWRRTSFDAIPWAVWPASTSALPSAGMWTSGAKPLRWKISASYAGPARRPVPVSAIDVQRTEVSHTEVKETPWAEEWKEAIRTILTGESGRYRM